MDKWIEAIKQVGFPIVIALMLLLFYLTEVKSMAASLKEHLEDMRQMVPILRQTCVNTSPTEAAKANCLKQ